MAIDHNHEAVSVPVFCRRSDRVFVRVHGRDPAKMVQGLITNDLALASDQRAVSAALLTPKGKMLAELRAFTRGNEVLLETAAGALDGLLAHFKKFVPPLFARFEVTDRYALVGVYGRGAAEVVTAALKTTLPAEEDALVVTDVLTIIRSNYAGEGFDLLTSEDPALLQQQLAAAGAQPVSYDVLERMRIEAGTPRWGAELDENVIPLEAGLRQRMISESKGCYTGQEVIIRILHRGHVNWLLRGMLLGDAAPPARGTPLFSADNRQVGRVASSVYSPEYAQTIGLGYARRELTLPARLHLGTADGPEVTVVELPFDATRHPATNAESR